MVAPTTIFVLLALATASAQGESCAIEGEPMHWIADWCMASLSTDDEIAASECISRELQRAPGTACAANAHYKRAMCELASARGTLQVNVEDCMKDPRFMGPAVRNRGVGGVR